MIDGCNVNIKCLACGSTNLLPSLDLGNQPLANSYLNSSSEYEQKYPLGVNVCRDCYHTQLTHIVEPAIIYKNYLYVTGTNDTIKEYSDWFAGYVVESIDRKTSNILDIGCNDGTQLDYFKSRGYNTFGVDPAENIHPISSAKHDVICDFFGPSIIEKIKYNFDAIIAQNVMAHNPDPFNFLTTCKKLMSEDTLLFVQTSQANMILNDEFDTIYHEHINFFNINSMNKLAMRTGLNLVDVFKTPIHGNSYVFVLSCKNSRIYNIKNKIRMEKSLQKLDTYIQWENNVKSNMVNLKKAILHYQQQGYKVIGYGAAAKGNTLLNFIDVKLDFIIDDNPLKQNLYTPGTKVLIKEPSFIKEFDPDDKIVFMPLAWNFVTEISKKIKTIRNMKQDIFLKYFPKVEIINV